MENFRPLNDNVLLVFPQGSRVESGVIVIGETDRRMDATVVAVGSAVSGAVRVGMTVVADRLLGRPVDLCDGVVYRLVRESDIVAERPV